MNQKKIVIILLGLGLNLLLGNNSYCQKTNNNSLNYENLSVHDWRADSSWFGDKHVKLIALPKTCAEDTRGWGERICFDIQGNFHYFYYMDCPVGETLFSIKSIVIENNLMVVEHQRYYWTKKPKKYKRSKYKLIAIKENQIDLRRVY
jgi:hypothetical protein